MSTTPNRHLPLMESSQAQPEVVYNAAMELLDTGEGVALEVEASGASPGVRNVSKIKFIGASVSEESGGVAVVTVDATTGGGSLELTDGTHDLTGVTKITISGGTVGGTAGAATITFSGGGGGGSANQSIDTHPASPDPMDDEGEGTTLDGKWSWLNQGTQTVTFNNGQIELNSTLQGSLRMGGIMQALPAGTFRIRAKMSSLTNKTGASYILAGMFVNTAGGAIISIDKTLGAGAGQVDTWTGPTGYVGAAATFTAFATAYEYRQPCWFEIERDATNLYFRFSQSGYDGDFVTEYTQAISGFAATNIGIFATNSNSSNPCTGYFDWFRRMA